MDHYNRGLEESIGAFDVPHNFKFSDTWDLPFGRGKAMLNHGGFVDQVVGGWRVSGHRNGLHRPAGSH